jgi:hypothetical protein
MRLSRPRRCTRPSDETIQPPCEKLAPLRRPQRSAEYWQFVENVIQQFSQGGE